MDPCFGLRGLQAAKLKEVALSALALAWGFVLSLAGAGSGWGKDRMLKPLL